MSIFKNALASVILFLSVATLIYYAGNQAEKYAPTVNETGLVTVDPPQHEMKTGTEDDFSSGDNR